MFNKLLSWWIKRTLIWQQKKNIATFTMLENYVTNSVLGGEKYKSNQLIDIQNKLDESKKFLKYLTKK